MEAILIHGGAGAIAQEREAEVELGLRLALDAAVSALQRGGDALAIAIAAVYALERNPSFNAGIGACLNLDGHIEHDACVMFGPDRSAGAVAGVSRLSSPVLAADEVRRSPHVLMAGKGAERFAAERGLELVEPESFVTERQLRSWQHYLATKEGSRSGTVGAVVCDAAGQVAAATSTGGMVGKLPGRIGDTPLVGAGTYATPWAACSATGYGEYFIRTLAARSAVDSCRSGRVQEAAEQAVGEVAQLGGEGGLILISSAGELAWHCNSANLAWAYWTPLASAVGVR
jgi:beta-aspartyl-peptidase (threonine type)